jgi:uncharacterized Zn finger protein (UPF0148 family)
VTVPVCPVCGYPMLELASGVVWCSVYGTHRWDEVESVLPWPAECTRRKRRAA